MYVWGFVVQYWTLILRIALKKSRYEITMTAVVARGCTSLLLQSIYGFLDFITPRNNTQTQAYFFLVLLGRLLLRGLSSALQVSAPSSTTLAVQDSSLRALRFSSSVAFLILMLAIAISSSDARLIFSCWYKSGRLSAAISARFLFCSSLVIQATRLKPDLLNRKHKTCN